MADTDGSLKECSSELSSEDRSCNTSCQTKCEEKNGPCCGEDIKSWCVKPINGFVNHDKEAEVKSLGNKDTREIGTCNDHSGSQEESSKTKPTAKQTSTDQVVENIAKIDLSETNSDTINEGVSSLQYVVYESEEQMPDIMRLITKDLSEPYSIYTYRYFIHNWPQLCFLAMDKENCVGAIVCKLDIHKKMVRRGYIAMLAIDASYRRRGIGSHLVMKAIKAMVADDCDEVVLETEITNTAALKLYENLGFVRDKRLFRYYLNGVDALRLKLWLR